MSELLKEKAEDAKRATIDTIDKREGILHIDVIIV
jgi:hypothetical protein